MLRPPGARGDGMVSVNVSSASECVTASVGFSDMGFPIPFPMSEIFR